MTLIRSLPGSNLVQLTSYHDRSFLNSPQPIRANPIKVRTIRLDLFYFNQSSVILSPKETRKYLQSLKVTCKTSPSRMRYLCLCDNHCIILTHNYDTLCFYPLTIHPLACLGLLIIESSRSHSIGHTALGRTPLDERSARH
jgi:hypothetical protein